MKSFKMALPRSVEDAVKSCGSDFQKNLLLAGGTDLLAEIKEGVEDPETVVNLKPISGLRGIRRTDRGLEIGALTTLAEVAEHPEVQKGWPALVATIGRTATPNVRNIGSLGGNLCQRVRCWYYRDETYSCLKKGGDQCYAQQGENEFHSIFDNGLCAAVHPSNSAPVLIAYGAQFDVTGAKGQSTMAAEDFFVSPTLNVTRENVLKPGDVLTTVILPHGSEKGQCAYVETREKQSFDWATCGSTVNLVVDGNRVKEARIVLSAVAPTPMRRRDLERKIAGKELTDTLIAEVCKAATTGARPLEQNKHKLVLVRATLRRALVAALKA